MGEAPDEKGVRSVSRSLRQRIRSRLRRLGDRYCIDLGRDHRSAIFVAGSSRSGTTWLAELINYRNEYHYVFEPFHPLDSDGPTPMEPGLSICRNFGYHQYLRPDTADLRFLVPAASVLAGKARSQWTERFNQRLITGRRIVKDITANLFLKWLSVNFPGMPIVFILRHPCAVAASRKALNWDVNWNLVLGRVLKQRALMEDFMEPFLERYQSASTYVEQQVLMWCLDNYVPLKQFTRHQIHVVFYENLMANPNVELPKLFSFLGKSADPSIYEVMQSPSLSDWNAPVRRGASRTDRWLNQLKREDLHRAMGILGAFGLDAIYGEDPFPNVAGLEQVMAASAAKRKTENAMPPVARPALRHL